MPTVNWQDAEHSDRARYSAEAERHSPYSPSDIAGMVDRPESVRQLLQNLKLAIDRDLLVQPAFMDEAVLLKFFNAATATWEKPNVGDAQSTQVAILHFSSSEFSAMSASVRFSHAHTPNYEAAEGHVPEHVYHSGDISINVESVPTFTVAAVVDVFGLPIDAAPDTGEATDGHSVVPTSKGWMGYDYSKNVLPTAALLKSVATFTVKRDATIRWPLSWRQGHFLCKGDELKTINVFEMER
jgi:hypothetical protein